MTYSEMLLLYENNEFRKIDEYINNKKFYLLRSISKSATLRKFCDKYNAGKNTDELLDNDNITISLITDFIRAEFQPVQNIDEIEAELNKMQNFDWGGSHANALEKNIVDIIKKTLKFNNIEEAVAGRIRESVYGYTLNSWYNHWSSIMLEEIFNANSKVLPTLDRIKNIDFFIDGVPFDLKVTYFPEELMKKKISERLKSEYGSVSELTCLKKIARSLNISVPKDLKDRALTICLQNLLRESSEAEARDFLEYLSKTKNEVIDYYKENSNELITWLYENQGERRFDAANRFYVVLVDSNNIFDSWKLKRNKNLLAEKINIKLSEFSSENLNEVSFKWGQTGKKYKCVSEVLFIIK